MQDNFNDEIPLEGIIVQVNEYLEKIESAKTKEDQARYLNEFRSYLEISSEEIAKQGDLYEAGGRLYSAAYYLEEYYPKNALELYQKAIDFYEKDLYLKIRDGAINEASNISLKIANIYQDKLQELEKSKSYVAKSIELVKQQILLIEGMGTLRELSSKHQMLSMLYGRLQDWPRVQETAKLALEFAKAIKEYSIIANAYHDYALAVEKLEDPSKAENILFEAMDYFAKESSLYESSQEFLPLSQLYYIMKNIYSALRDPKRFQIYSRKEAASYVALAKVGLLNFMHNAQIASYYRGAALCYRETNRNDLECATCFYLAGNYYNDAKRFIEAALSFQDAAIIFERLNKLKKVFELYLQAGLSAIKANNLEVAIENFIQGYEIGVKENFDLRKITKILIKYILQLAKIEVKAKNFFTAASLYLESAYYSHNNIENKKEIINYLELMHTYYYQAALEVKENTRRSSIAYIFTLAILSAKLFSHEDHFNELFLILQKMDSQSATLYLRLLKTILTLIDSNRNSIPNVDIYIENRQLKKLFEASEELKKILFLYFRNIHKNE